jgi:hypothetical protein
MSDNLKIYTNKSDQNIINKDKEIVSTLECTFKDNIDILNPILLIKNYTGGNYCYILDFERYYFIDDVSLLKGGVYQLHCSVDVLQSYADELENSEYYSSDGVLHTVENEIEFTEIYNPEKFILIMGV